jgi:hypothetical protein
VYIVSAGSIGEIVSGFVLKNGWMVNCDWRGKAIDYMYSCSSKQKFRNVLSWTLYCTCIDHDHATMREDAQLLCSQRTGCVSAHVYFVEWVRFTR